MPDKKRHVMVVDDEEPMRTLLRDFFHSVGYRVDCYSSAASALKCLREGEEFSAVVTDIRMKPVDGIEFLKKLKGEFPSLPVVLFTAAGNPEERDVAIQCGATQYFTKPFSLTELRRVIDQTPIIPSKKKA
jgi:DNA-binding NtrC family response regulator